MMILASPSETNLKVLEIENQSNLPVEFLDSIRSDDDFVFYEFKLSSRKPLLLRKLAILEEGKGSKKEFAISSTKSGSAMITLSEDSPAGSNAAKIEGDYSLLTSETFKHDYNITEGFLAAELTDSYFLSAIYEFEEGNIKVKYLFSDKETHAFWLFFWLIPISASVVLTGLYFLSARFRKNEAKNNL
ncbi:MAG: hypothetical protein WC634_01370 [archaeon]